MKHYADREYLHTRIHAMKGRLMRLRDYASFAREWETARNDDGRVNENEVVHNKERLFEEQIQGVMILAEASDYHSPLFFAFLRYFEIQNCGTLMAASFGRDTPGQWYPIGRYALVERSLLEAPPSLPFLRKLLKGTYLEEICGEAGSYERLQIRMEECALTQVLAAAETLDHRDRRLVMEMTAMRVALETTLRRRRLERYYEWDTDKIEKAMAFMNRIPAPDLARYVTVMEELFQREGEAIKKDRGMEPALDDIEYRLEQYYHQWISHFFYRDFHSICSVVAYLWLVLRQVRNLFGVVDGRRFGLSQEAILGRLVSES